VAYRQSPKDPETLKIKIYLQQLSQMIFSHLIGIQTFSILDPRTWVNILTNESMDKKDYPKPNYFMNHYVRFSQTKINKVFFCQFKFFPQVFPLKIYSFCLNLSHLFMFSVLGQTKRICLGYT